MGCKQALNNEIVSLAPTPTPRQRKNIPGNLIRASIPPHISKRVKMGGNCRDCLTWALEACLMDQTETQPTVTIIEISSSTKNVTKVTEAITRPSLVPVRYLLSSSLPSWTVTRISFGGSFVEWRGDESTATSFSNPKLDAWVDSGFSGVGTCVSMFRGVGFLASFDQDREPNQLYIEGLMLRLTRIINASSHSDFSVSDSS